MSLLYAYNEIANRHRNNKRHHRSSRVKRAVEKRTETGQSLVKSENASINGRVKNWFLPALYNNVIFFNN
jgi:hypothetical protein